jgi:hypothetical protein
MLICEIAAFRTQTAICPRPIPKWWKENAAMLLLSLLLLLPLLRRPPLHVDQPLVKARGTWHSCAAVLSLHNHDTACIPGSKHTNCVAAAAPCPISKLLQTCEDWLRFSMSVDVTSSTHQSLATGTPI